MKRVPHVDASIYLSQREKKEQVAKGEVWTVGEHKVHENIESIANKNNY